MSTASHGTIIILGFCNSQKNSLIILFRVSAHIIYTHRRYNYTSTNDYDIAKIFDEMSDSFKNQISRQKSGEKHKESVRYFPKE